MSKRRIGLVSVWGERGAGYVTRQYYDLIKDSYDVFLYERPFTTVKHEGEWSIPNHEKSPPYYLSVPTAIKKKHFKDWIDSNKLELLFFNEQQWLEPVFWAKEWGLICGSYVDYYTEDTVPLFAVYDFLICNTKRHFSVFNWHPNVYYVPWGTDLKRFPFSGKSAAEEGKIIFFHSAGVSPERKGTLETIEAFSALEQKNCKLILHTQVELQKVFPQFSQPITQLQSEGRLEIISGTVGAPGLYHMADVYVYPSRLDGIGLTMAEALSCGLALIVPDNPPMNEFGDQNCRQLVKIDRYVSRADGYYWPQCLININSLTSAMSYFANNSHLLNSWKTAARLNAEQYLDWSKNKEDINRIFSHKEVSTNWQSCKKEYLRQVQVRGSFEMKMYSKNEKLTELYLNLKALIRGIKK